MVEKLSIDKNGTELASLEPNLEDHGDPVGGSLICRNLKGKLAISLTGGNNFAKDSGGGEITVCNGFGNSRVLILHGDLSENMDGGIIILQSSTNPNSIVMNGSESTISIKKGANDSILMKGSNAALYIGNTNNEGDVFVRNDKGNEVIHMNGGDANVYIGNTDNEGDIILRDQNGKDSIHLEGGSGIDNEGGMIFIKDAGERQVLEFNSKNAALYIGNTDNEGDIFLRNNEGNNTIHLDGGSGDIILENADCAEEFDIYRSSEIEPGTVMIISNDGKLEVSSKSYDRRVAGVISGGGNLKPGIVLDKKKSKSSRAPLAMLGKVYCKVDADQSPIKIGDMLTTSKTPGHAMKAVNRSQAFGAVVGKALMSLSTGKGIIPILIALQ
ncbi:MAG TPA: hypothetical protein VD694_03210 [Nitrososphaeraceae archaeon]|nr:hypothetical protein [Nitrososphaeraceae archaeon]